MRAMAAGDEAALHELFTRHTPWLAVRLRRRCGDAEAVADVVQDTFVAAWRGAGRWRGDGEVAAWLWGIAVRRLVSRLRGSPAPLVLDADQLAAHESPLASAEDQVLLGLPQGTVKGRIRKAKAQLRGDLVPPLVARRRS